MPKQLASPLDTERGDRFIQLCRSLNWVNRASGLLLAGWLYVAIIGGALRWRPHLFLTGPAGCGKTSALVNIVNPVLGDWCLRIGSASTPAGIRQRIGNDALPIIFDETDRNDAKGQEAMQSTLEYIRSNSDDTDGEILKGTPGGHSQSYKGRSCYLLAGVSPVLKHAADESRFTIAELKAPLRLSDVDVRARDAAYREFLAEQRQLITPDFSRAFFARSCAMVKVLRKNADTFCRSAALLLGDHRAGNQIGTMIAGYHGLRSDGTVSQADADHIVNREVDLSYLAPDEEGRDQYKCLMRILQSEVSLELESGLRSVRRTVGDLLEDVRQARPNCSAAREALRRNGISLESDGFHVATQSKAIEGMLAGTHFAGGWSRHLLRLPGARSDGKKRVRFSGIASCVTWIPYSALPGEQQPEPAPTTVDKDEFEEEEELF